MGKPLLVLALVSLLAATAYAEPLPVRIVPSLGAHYSTGDYGSSETTDILYVPFGLRADISSWTARLTIPYIYIDGGETVVEGPDGPILAPAGGAGGLGDILLEGAYTIAPLAGWMPFVELSARLKTPTADDGEGLGTGEPDLTLEIELVRRYGDLTPFLSVGYRFLGAPSGTDLDDGLLAAGGLLYRLIPAVDVGLFVTWRQSSTSFTEDPLDIVPFLSWRISPAWIADTYVSAGLSEGSPEAGVGLQVRHRLDFSIGG